MQTRRICRLGAEFADSTHSYRFANEAYSFATRLQITRLVCKRVPARSRLETRHTRLQTRASILQTLRSERRLFADTTSLNLQTLHAPGLPVCECCVFANAAISLADTASDKSVCLQTGLVCRHAIHICRWHQVAKRHMRPWTCASPPAHAIRVNHGWCSKCCPYGSASCTCGQP